MIRTTVSHHRILEKLGGGGMLSRFAGVSPPRRTGARRRNPPQAGLSGLGGVGIARRNPLQAEAS